MKIKCNPNILFVILTIFTLMYDIGYASSATKKPYQEEISQSPFSIEGKVIDQSGNPLIGVNIVVKGTDKGTSTDLDGNFILENIEEDVVLIVSYIGYQTQELNVDSRDALIIEMVSDSQLLDEIVVVGYGTQKKENLTGAVSTINTEMILSRPVQNTAQMLQGVSPGLNITQNNGMIENKPSINIRGVGTIGQGSSSAPLILIDGMEGDINTINSQDIAEISVLKDAAASSIYGSRAPFGVILITTKTGTKGKSQINYSNSFRSISPLLLPKMMNSLDFATYFNDASVNGGGNVFFDTERIKRIEDFMEGRISTTTLPDPGNPQIWWQGYNGGNDNVDWFRALYRERTFAQEHNLAMNGGSDNMQYYVSGQIVGQDGLMVFNQDGYKRYSANGKVNGNLNNWATISYNARFIREDYHRPAKLTSTLFTDLARQAWPVIPLYDPNGFLYSSPSPALGLRDGGKDIQQNDRFYQQLQLTVEPVENWKIISQINYRIEDDFRHWNIQSTYNHDIDGVPYVFDRNNSVHEQASRENYNSNSFYSEYNNTVGIHYFKVMGGLQSEFSKYRNLGATRDGVILPNLPVIDLTSGTDYDGNPVLPPVNGKYEDWSTVGYFGRLNYNFDERYLLEFNLRRDGSSRYRVDNRWLWSPSVSAGWNIAREKFWKSLDDDIPMFKLRASYGKLGNQNTTSKYPTYLTMPIGTTNSSWLINGTKSNTANAPGLVSQLLTWESIRSWNIGLDFALFSGKLTSSFDYYVRYTDNMVGPAPELPIILGTAVPSTNNTDLKTNGFEWEVAWNERFSNGINTNARFILSDAKTTILNYPNPSGLLSSYVNGRAMGEIWGYETIGIAKSQEEMNSHLASLPNGGQNALGSQFGAGDIMYRDINGDGKVDAGANTIHDHGDLTVIGNNTPRYLIGLDLGIIWKGVDARAFFQGVLKQDYFQDSYYFWGASTGGIWWSTGLEEHKDYFRADPENPMGLNLDSYYAQPLFGAMASKNQQVQTRYLQDASYVRLKNLQIGYTLPPPITSKISINRIRVFFSGENLFTLSSMSKIFDPETIGGGWGGNVYPLSKIYSFGLNINF